MVWYASPPLPSKPLYFIPPSRHLDENQKGGCVKTGCSGAHKLGKLGLNTDLWGPRCANFTSGDSIGDGGSHHGYQYIYICVAVGRFN